MSTNQILRDKSFRRSIILTAIFLTTGFVFLAFSLAEYGWLFFMVLPIALGISIGALPNRKVALYGLLTAVVLFLMFLVGGQLEGFICVIMALPIVIPLMFVGSVISHLVKRYRQIKSTENMKVLILPLGIFVLGAFVEKVTGPPEKAVMEVRSEITLPYSAEDVYDAIKSVDTLVAEKTFLMNLDLPVPRKCVLENEAVGGIRTCHFDGGTIVERITALERGRLLQMDVIDYNLTGAKWLGFVEAIYTFEPMGPGMCRMTRITTYTSALKPRFYWSYFERVGIEQEHEYVFRNLRNDLASRER